MAALGLPLLVAPGCAGSDRKQDVAPNILLVITDDQPSETVSHMPFLRNEIAAKGVSFERAYCGDPLCDPSRSCVFLGKHLHNHRMPANDDPGGGARVFKERGWETKTYLYHLKDLGYDVGYFGKWLHHEWGHTPEGVDRAFTFVGSPHRPGHFEVYDSRDRRNQRVGRRNRDGSENWDDTDLMREKAEKWIRDRRDSGRPFVCVFAPFAPHGPYGDDFVPERVEERFDDASRPSGPYDDLPEHYEATAKGRDDDKNIREYRDKLKEVRVVDDAMRALTGAVESVDRTGSTYVFFTTDQPYMLGEHGLRTKGTFYDHSSKVPLFVRGPEVPQGVATDALATNVDLFATFLDIAGGDPALLGSSDGRSLLPAMQAKTPDGWRKRVLVEHEVGEGFRMIREDRLCYVEFENGDKLAYDMVEDPDQTTNIHWSLDASEQERLAGALAAFDGCSGKACRVAEDAP